MTNICVGIDYSMTGPACCIHEGDVWSIDNCYFFYLTNKRVDGRICDRFSGQSVDTKNFSCSEERFEYLSNFFCNIIPKNSMVFIEAYSFGSKGMTFQIGENTGVLKNKLYNLTGKHSNPIAPSAVKKMATGKGNKVDKVDMCNAFVQETNLKMDSYFECKFGSSPMSDVVDSYYVCKSGFDFLHNPNTKIIVSI